MATARVPAPVLPGYFPIHQAHDPQAQLSGSSSSCNGLIEFPG